MESDYEDVVRRLISERLVQKFVLKFPDDGSFGVLLRSLECGAQEEAFRAAHTLKGMCQNLGFSKLGISSSLITEALRGGDMDGARELLERASKDYERTVEVIRAFQASLSI